MRISRQLLLRIYLRMAETKKSAPSRDKKTKDPEGGLTQAGRAYFKKTEGANLKPGVKGAADTPEKQKRKGSFLRRHFANPRGPMEKDGKPTRQALSAHAWGEPVPKTMVDAKKLAAKGTKLLERYESSKKKMPVKKAVRKKSAAAKSPATKAAKKKSAE